MAFVYIPNGVIQKDWNVKGEHRIPMSHITASRKLREDLLVFSGLAHEKAEANGDGAGDHARANATFLTGCQARKTSGADIDWVSRSIRWRHNNWWANPVAFTGVEQ